MHFHTHTSCINRTKGKEHSIHNINHHAWNPITQTCFWRIYIQISRWYIKPPFYLDYIATALLAQERLHHRLSYIPTLKIGFPRQPLTSTETRSCIWNYFTQLSWWYPPVMYNILGGKKCWHLYIKTLNVFIPILCTLRELCAHIDWYFRDVISAKTSSRFPLARFYSLLVRWKRTIYRLKNAPYIAQ